MPTHPCLLLLLALPFFRPFVSIMRPLFLALLLGATLLGGCGFKGDLYLPEHRSPQAIDPAEDDNKPAELAPKCAPTAFRRRGWSKAPTGSCSRACACVTWPNATAPPPTCIPAPH